MYNLLNACCPELIKQLQLVFPNQTVVAANLLIRTEFNKYTATITSDTTIFDFPLDLYESNYQSKGNWIWITKLNINCADEQLFSCNINKRVIDIPYCKTQVCAHALLKNFYPELSKFLTKKLHIEIFGT